MLVKMQTIRPASFLFIRTPGGPLESSLGSNAHEGLRTQDRPLIRAERRLSGARRALKPAAACGCHTALWEALQLPIAHRQPPTGVLSWVVAPRPARRTEFLPPARGLSSHELTLPLRGGGGKVWAIISLDRAGA